jgi:hypothetical protein
MVEFALIVNTAEHGRDATGHTLRTTTEAAGRTTFRDAGGRTTTTVQQTGSSTTARDAGGRTVGTTFGTGAKR